MCIRDRDTGTKNENIRFSLFGEGTNHEWSFTVDNAKSKDHAAVSEAIICKRDSTTCTAEQKSLIQPSLSATTSGLDIFVTDFSKTAAYVGAFVAGGGNPQATGAAAQIDALAMNQVSADRYSSNLSEDTFIEREDTLISGKFKSFRDDYDLTILVSTNQNDGGELKDFDSTAAKSFVQGSTQKTNQSSLEIRWNSKPEDEIQWVAGIYSYLDYGDRSDIFRTGPDSVFNQAAVAATAYLDAGLYSQTNLSVLQGLANYTPTASKSPLVATYNVATGTTLDTYGTAQLDLSINNKSSAAFGQVTIPMAERWSITLGARYTYDNKGMRYETKSNSTGIPHSLILPGCTPTTVNPDGSVGCSDFVQGTDATIYTSEQYGGQAAVVAAAVAAAPTLASAPTWEASCTFDNTNTIGSDAWGVANAALIGSTACNTNFEIVANAQGVGIAPIADASQLFVLNQEKSWTSTDPKMTIDFKPDDRSMVWYTYATGFKAGGWQFANYFESTARQGFDPEELEMHAFQALLDQILV